MMALSCESAQSQTKNAPAFTGTPAPMVASEKPKEFEGVGITENLGKKLDLALKFKDESGREVSLGTFFDGRKPVLLTLIYFSCPGLCNLHLNGVFEALKKMEWSAGQKFEVVAISFDPKEGSELAAKKKENYLKEYLRPGTDSGIHFLTADQQTIDQFTNMVGFHYKWNEQANEWAHASAAMIATGDGKLARYLHGIQFEPEVFKLALNEAANGKIGSLMDKMVWYCFRYDPKTSKYTLYAFRMVQVGAALIVFALLAVLVPFWIRSRRAAK